MFFFPFCFFGVVLKSSSTKLQQIPLVCTHRKHVPGSNFWIFSPDMTQRVWQKKLVPIKSLSWFPKSTPGKPVLGLSVSCQICCVPKYPGLLLTNSQEPVTWLPCGFSSKINTCFVWWSAQKQYEIDMNKAGTGIWHARAYCPLTGKLGDQKRPGCLSVCKPELSNKKATIPKQNGWC